MNKFTQIFKPVDKSVWEIMRWKKQIAQQLVVLTYTSQNLFLISFQKRLSPRLTFRKIQESDFIIPWTASSSRQLLNKALR